MMQTNSRMPIHGYGGSPHNAAYAALQANNCTDIVSPAIDYDAESTENILGKLRYIIAEKSIELLSENQKLSISRYF